MPELAGLPISQVQRQDHQGQEVAGTLWIKEWGESAGQESFKELTAVSRNTSGGPSFYHSSLMSRGNQNRKSEGTSGLCGKELSLILK